MVATENYKNDKKETLKNTQNNKHFKIGNKRWSEVLYVKTEHDEKQEMAKKR